MKINSFISAYVLLLLLLTSIALPWISWVLTAFGMSCNSMLSDEGIRWSFIQMSDAMMSHYTIIFIQLIVALGALKRCGLLTCYSQLKKLPLMVTLFVLAGGLSADAYFALSSSSPLLNITGTLLPSAWEYGTPSFLTFMLILSATLYGVVTQQVKSIVHFSEVITYGLSHYSIYVVIAVLTTYIIESINYIFS